MINIVIAILYITVILHSTAKCMAAVKKLP